MLRFALYVSSTLHFAFTIQLSYGYFVLLYKVNAGQHHNKKS